MLIPHELSERRTIDFGPNSFGSNCGKGRISNKHTYLGDDGDFDQFMLEGVATKSPHLFGRGMPFIYPSIWEGIAIYLAIYLGEGGYRFVH